MDALTLLVHFVIAPAALILLFWCLSDGLQGLYRGVRRSDTDLKRTSVAAIFYPCITAGFAMLPMYLDSGDRPSEFPLKPIDIPGYVLLIYVCRLHKNRVKNATAESAGS